MGFIFGSPNYETDSSSAGSKEKSLLETVPRRRRARARAVKYPKPSKALTFCGCIGNMLVLFLPLVAVTFQLAFLIILAIYDTNALQEANDDVDEDAVYDYYDFAKLYYDSISADTISIVMSQFEPYPVLLGLSSTSCILMCMVTIARNIQIEVYQRRVGSYCFMMFFNYLAAIINVLAYVGLMLAVNFKCDTEDPEWHVGMHFMGWLTFFGGSAVYAILHAFLLWRQTEYPTLIKWLFYILSAVIIGSSLAFAIPIWTNGIISDEGALPVAEWVAVFASAVMMGFYFILFFIDPVDDQLSSFFCSCCNKVPKPTREQMYQRRLDESNYRI
jgi:hypothetical protein